MLEAPAEIIVLSITALDVAAKTFNGCQEVFLVIRPKRFEDDAGNENGCPEDEDVRSQGLDTYWRRHDDVLRYGF